MVPKCKMQKKSQKLAEVLGKNLLVHEKALSLQTQNENRLSRSPLIGNFTTFIPWCGSSVWLEYRPVTPGVAGSSPVRTADKILKINILRKLRKSSGLFLCTCLTFSISREPAAHSGPADNPRHRHRHCLTLDQRIIPVGGPLSHA